MKYLIPAMIAVVALTGCDRLIGDHHSPYRVQGPDRLENELEPGLYRAVPPSSVDGCTYALFRNGTPVQWSEVHDSVPIYIHLPETTEYSDWGMTTVGCGEWRKVQ